MDVQGKSELVIENVGCGTFQVIHVLCVGLVSYLSMSLTNHFMAFGNYNPGWRCLDPHNDTIHGDNMTTLTDAYQVKKMYGINSNITSLEYSLGDCSVFESCKNVEFNPEAFTIVTEWGLVCSKAWIPSFMISLQMAGFLIGVLFAGTMGDMYGRKLVNYMAVVFLFIFNVIALFSNSWQMFAALILLLGVAMSFISSIYFIYMAEFVTTKWRAIVLGIPFYPICVVIFGIICVLFKNWRHIQITIIVTCLIGIMPVCWLPESLRWLEVKNKTLKFQRAAQKIAKCNGKPLPPLEQPHVEAEVAIDRIIMKDMLRNIRMLFKKEYMKYTVVVSLPWFSVTLIYYAIAFGVKDLSGDYYLNLILFYAIEIVIDGFTMFAPNVFGRKKAGVALCGFTGIGLLVAAVFQQHGTQSARMYGVTIPVMLGRIGISAFWCVLQVFMVELYPTVVRGAASSWGLILARIGGIIAPVLIPNEAGTLYICYAIMGTLGVICAMLVMLLPETRGKALQETYAVRTSDEVENDDEVM